LVLCDADHLPVLHVERVAVPDVVPVESLLSPRGVVSGDPVLWPVRTRPFAAAARPAVDCHVPRRLLAVRSAARFFRGSGVMTAIELSGVSKVYRRYSARRFATLKSALLGRSLLRDLRPDQTFLALNDVSFGV